MNTTEQHALSDGLVFYDELTQPLDARDGVRRIAATVSMRLAHWAQGTVATLTAAIMVLLAPGVSSAHTRTSSQSHRAVAVTVLARGAGYGDRSGSNQVRNIQRWLRYRPGRVDGFYGPTTETAVRGFQSQHQLAADGVVGPATVRESLRYVAAWGMPGLRRGIVFAGSATVRKVQRRLGSLGYDPGPVDGVFGSRTARAVETFQRAEALPIDGILGLRTRVRLRRPFMAGRWSAGPVSRGSGYWRPGGSMRVRELQRRMRRLGLRPGPVDGLFGPRTELTVRRFQRRHGLVVDGIVGAKTLSGLRGLAVDGLVGKRTALRPRRAAPETQRRSHVPRAATSAHGSTPTKRSASLQAPRPNTISPDNNNRSPDVVATVVLSGLLAALAVLAVGWWLGRRVSRARSPGPERTETAPAAQDGAWVSANGAGNGSPPSPAPHRDDVIGYVTTATDAWSDADEGSAAAIQARCEGSGWNLREVVWDRENGRTLDRPGLSYALQRIAEGRARGLVVSDLQRLSRSPDDLGVLTAWFRDANARLVALDLDLDTQTVCNVRRPTPTRVPGTG